MGCSQPEGDFNPPFYSPNARVDFDFHNSLYLPSSLPLSCDNNSNNYDMNKPNPPDWARQSVFRKFKEEVHGKFGTVHTFTTERVKKTLSDLSNGILPNYYPAQIQINPTSSCPRKRTPLGDCVNCSFPGDGGNIIEIDGLLSALENFADNGGHSVFLSGGGEPGAYPHLDQLSNLCLKIVAVGRLN